MTQKVFTRILRATLPVAEFARKFRSERSVQELCGECPNYGQRWGCPPLSEAEQRCVADYEQIELWVVQIFPSSSDSPISEAYAMINAQREVLEPQMLAREAEVGGRAALFTGMCLHCPGQACERVHGKPCRHSDLVRPSLEALGFDLGRVVKEVFDIEMLWGHDGRVPAYLTIVGGVFL